MIIRPMKLDQANSISQWKYDEPYDLYNPDDSDEGINELLNGDYYVALNGNEVVGYFCFGSSAQVPGAIMERLYKEDGVDIGLALRPDLTGKGLGKTFIIHGINFAFYTFQSRKLRLSVACFNKRAIKVYQDAGFILASPFTNNNMKFIIMEKPLNEK
ncbi:GNAT family N-acetyltransferase [Aquibacillus halophilus]|uniref:GNAT family N-acetyltransferase n=1 Tax=Aquibacillus halophilus TaxID=930132 RepID=A0A6A8D8C6_9BACI|nr:GNAT family N-acetyltransferase [Aquibacillus halophilus]MRH41838.1 GNAT family N-acetyltransferase [Aquibacillus halophilus]